MAKNVDVVRAVYLKSILYEHEAKAGFLDNKKGENMADKAAHGKLAKIVQTLGVDAKATIEADAGHLLVDRATLFAREALRMAYKRARARSAASGAEEEEYDATLSDLRAYIVSVIGEDVCGFEADELETIKATGIDAGVNRLHVARLAARNNAIALQNLPTVRARGMSLLRLTRQFGQKAEKRVKKKKYIEA